MRYTVHFTRMNGREAVAIADVDAEGAIGWWQIVDPTTGAHVDTTSGDKFIALGAINAQIRGAA